MKQISLLAIMVIAIGISCTRVRSDFEGEWEGTTLTRSIPQVKAIETKISCEITAPVGLKKRLRLKVGGAEYEFDAYEEISELVYKNSILLNDTTEARFITGNAELIGDTLLRFKHEIFTLDGIALVNSMKEEYEMKRKK